MKIIFLLLGFVIAILLVCKCEAQVYKNCKVVYVIDGDTFYADLEGSREKIRLSCIDAPELAQEYGNKSKNYLKFLIENKLIEIQVIGSDHYGRKIAKAYLKGLYVNYQMVCNGLAWAYVKYCRDERFYEAENNAKYHKLGLFSRNNPISPWEFRNNFKS